MQSARMICLKWWVLAAVAVFLTQHIIRWGRPVHTKFVLQGEEFPNQGGWSIRRLSDPEETWRALDVDHDGVMDEFETPNGNWKRPIRPKRWLVICIDGVPLAEMRRLWDEGHFREFYRPSALISTFPSDTETALTSALNAAPVPGYEHRFFDRARNELRGGAWITLTGKDIPYLGKLDYDEPGVFKGLHFILQRKSYRADVGRFMTKFRKGHAGVFVAHIASTDALFHILQPEEVRPLLLELEPIIQELYLDAVGDLGVIVFSDHGNTLTPSRVAPLEALFKHHGWVLTSRLRDSRGVVVPAYGLIGFLAAYCRDEAAPQLAKDLATLEGADLVVYRDSSENGAWVLSPDGGRAHLRWSPDGQRYWYEAESGDPLKLLPVFVRLRSSGQLEEDGSASDANLFQATADAWYPDSAARIRGWAINHVQNRASIAVSFKPGYLHGSGVFDRIVKMASTHGALDAPSSLGLAMATYPLPVVLRLGELIPRERVQSDSRGPSIQASAMP